jgi:TRAP-type C4-dicarboxylate transport system substrate-binding protein
MVLTAIVAIAFAAGIALYASASARSPGETRHVRWLLSHQPTDVFARSAEVFRAELAQRTGGRLMLDVVTPEDIGYGTAGDVPNAKVLEELRDGSVELATTYTAALGSSDPALWSINLPFLFSDYAGAAAALDGARGRALLETVASSTDMHALAFTMSGGFRILASKAPLAALSDLKGKRIATSAGPVAEATLRALGAIPVPTDLENAGAVLDPATIDAVETTYSRLSQVAPGKSAYTAHIAETYHSLFLTVILASDSFYGSLSPADRSALQEAALAAARVEREDSIALGEAAKRALASNGTDIVVLSADDREAARQATLPVYDAYAREYGEEAISALLQ